eukprot:m.160498 g.160498  ORF g.160498 m.160498 type:complete len:854 (+) comp16501_c0_seq2:45-2606(+)
MAPLRLLAVLCLVKLSLPAPCTRDGGSQDCSCSGSPSITTVVCDFKNITPSVPRLTSTVTVFSSAHNQITRLTELSFSSEILSPLTRLQRVNLRSNDITAIGIGTFDFVSDLRTLDISFNSISAIAEETFRRLANLQILRLNNNDISAIAPGAFNSLTSLEELYLDNNNLLTLNANWFKALRKLRVLRLDRNNITIMPVGLLSNNNPLNEFSISLNQIHTIPENSFASNLQLTELQMLGNPSSCGKVGQDTRCECEQGYGGRQQFDEYCEPRDCGASILDLTPNASATCTGLTVFRGDPCTATCDAGFRGSPANSAQFTCNTDGEWEGNLTCEALDCGSTIPDLDVNALATCVGNTRFGGNNCLADCRPGFDGGPIEYTCNTQGQWTATTSPISCSRISCDSTIRQLEPAKTIAACVDTLFEDTCEARCRVGYNGGPTTFTCSAEGFWRGSLDCIGAECGRSIPALPADRFSQCRGDSSFGGDNCFAQCRLGYEGPSREYDCQSSGQWQALDIFTPLPACTPLPCEAKIERLAQVLRTSECTNGTLFGAKCQAVCQPGYVGRDVTFTCGPFQVWEGDRTIPCEPRQCGLLDPKELHVEVLEECDSQAFGTQCASRCLRGYEGLEANIVCSEDGSWTRTSPCIPVDCGPYQPLVPGQVNQVDTEQLALIDTSSCDNFFEAEPCQATCKGGQPSAVSGQLTCQPDGEWSGTFECQGAAKAASSGLSTGATFGVTFGILVLIVLIAVLVFLLRSRPANNSAKVSSDFASSKSTSGTMQTNPMRMAPTRSTSKGANAPFYEVTPARAPRSMETSFRASMSGTNTVTKGGFSIPVEEETPSQTVMINGIAVPLDVSTS